MLDSIHNMKVCESSEDKGGDYGFYREFRGSVGQRAYYGAYNAEHGGQK